MSLSPRQRLMLLLAAGALLYPNSERSALAAPALKPSAKAQDRKLQLARIQALATQLMGGFERAKIGKDPLSDYLDLLEQFGRAKRDLAETSEKRIDAALSVLRQFTVVERQIRELNAVGLQPQKAVSEAEAARRRAEDLLKSLTDAP